MFHQQVHDATVDTWEARRATLLSRGFIVLPQFITSDTVEQLHAECEKLMNPDGPVTYGIVRDRHNDVVVMNRLDRESDLLFDLARHPTLLRVAGSLLSKPAISLHVEYFAKAPARSSNTPPHQDHIFYHDHFADELAISIWIALDDVTATSGALEFSTLAHSSLLPHVESSAVDFDFELPPQEGTEFTPALVPMGGCLVHHSYAVHRAGKNATEQPRRAIVFNYRGSPYRQAMQAVEP